MNKEQLRKQPRTRRTRKWNAEDFRTLRQLGFSRPECYAITRASNRLHFIYTRQWNGYTSEHQRKSDITQERNVIHALKCVINETLPTHELEIQREPRELIGAPITIKLRGELERAQ